VQVTNLEIARLPTVCCRLLSRISKTGTIMTGKVKSRPRHSASLTATVDQLWGRFRVMMSLVFSPKAAYPICMDTTALNEHNIRHVRNAKLFVLLPPAASA